MIKNIILLMFLISSSIFASEARIEVKWAKNFETGMKEAARFNKPVMFVSSRHTCRFCVILEDTTFSDAMIIKDLNENFITIVSYSDENDYIPRNLWRPGTPAIWFLNSDGAPMFQPLMGAVGIKDFQGILPQVKQEFNTLQKKEKNDFYKLEK